MVTDYCIHCLWDITQRDSGTWVLVRDGAASDHPAAPGCSRSPDGRHVPAAGTPAAGEGEQ